MSRRSVSFLIFGLLFLSACGGEELARAGRHLEELCSSSELSELYLDFYWDDLRSHQPELWAEALRQCTEICPSAVNCGPVLSVASWYRTDAATDPFITGATEE